MKNIEKILVLCAHSDDEVISMGGSIAKYSSMGKKVKVIIFTAGEKSVPWIKEQIITKKRKKEGELTSKSLGCEIEFLDIPDMELEKNKEETTKRIRKIIRKFKPKKIFTHSKYDFHPDHRSVFKIVKNSISEFKKKPKLFTFIIWGAFNPKDSATFSENIDGFFEAKIKALKEFKTQKLFVYLNYIPIFIKNRFAGFRKGSKYAELFYVENA